MSLADRMRTPDDLLQLFQEYSVEGSDGTLAGNSVKVPVIRQIVDREPAKLRHTKMADDRRIAFVELRKSTTRDEETQEQQQAIQRLADSKEGGITAEDFPRIEQEKQRISSAYAQTESKRGKSTLKTLLRPAATADTVPCYYLPWNPTGGAVELKIPDMGGGAVADNNPILFLTAALSGCSIYVKGPANSPTIWHCGTAANTTGATASAFWNSVMSQLGEDPAGIQAIHNRDYMVPMRGEKDEMKEAQQREKQVRKDLQSRFKKVIEVEEVRTWGAVFGVRRGSNWSFYMQENCTVTYHKVTKKGLRRVDAGEGARVYSRPVFCREIFPAGGAKAQCFQHLRALKT
jgi:hypothetical protein